jgi:hypothetical protein
MYLSYILNIIKNKKGETMQLEIIYVNKSTILPVDYKMKEEINKIINHSLILNEQNKLNQLNIFFVSEVEFYNDIMKRDKRTYKIEDLSFFDTEFLGVYIEKSDELNGQILIKSTCSDEVVLHTLRNAFVPTSNSLSNTSKSTIFLTRTLYYCWIFLA